MVYLGGDHRRQEGKNRESETGKGEKPVNLSMTRLPLGQLGLDGLGESISEKP